MLQIGDRINDMCPSELEQLRSEPESYPATVVYVHPEHRYFELKFELPGGTLREAFYFYPRCAATQRGGRKIINEGNYDNQSQGRGRQDRDRGKYGRHYKNKWG